jgi:predicted phage-related endonuclease
MAIGVHLEPYVAQWAAKKLGVKVRANPFTREHPKVPLCATPDYLVLNTRMLMEVKVSSIMYGWNEDDLHPWYEYQARAQMACTGRDAVLVVALVGSAFHMVPVVRNDVKERMLTNAVEEFFQQYVLPGIPPEQEAPATRVSRVVVQGSK